MQESLGDTSYAKVVRKFYTFEEAEEAEYAYYKALSGDEKLQMLLS